MSIFEDKSSLRRGESDHPWQPNVIKDQRVSSYFNKSLISAWLFEVPNEYQNILELWPKIYNNKPKFCSPNNFISWS